MLRVFFRRQKWFASVSASSASKGSVILVDGRYLEVEKNESKHVARQAGYIKLEALDILTGKVTHMQLSANGKVNKVETVKVPTQVQYVDEAAGVLVVADADFNPVEVPLAYCREFAPFMMAGDTVTLVKDTEEDKLVKCLFSLPILQRSKTMAKK